ncbi:MAG: VOC family protein [Actinomycetota bacterium]
MKTRTKRSSATTMTDEDPRPRFAIGHISVPANDPGRLAEFYEAIGMRRVARMPGAAIIELRGGTHLVFTTRGVAGNHTLDLIVDDLDETRAVLVAAGATPSDTWRQGPHLTFTTTDPEGNTLVVNSTHAIGPV